MTGVRPLDAGDLPAVGDLFGRVLRAPGAGPGLAAHLRRILLDHPSADPDIPSLVAVGNDGRPVGFLGAHVRRLRLHGKPVRVAFAGHFAADPASGLGAGALLARAMRSGPQDATLTDGGTFAMQPVWEMLGGRLLGQFSLGWIRLFRPFSAGAELLATRGSPGALARSLRLVSSPLDALLRSRPVRPLVPPPPGGHPEAATVESFAELGPLLARRFELHPDYDPSSIDWMLHQLNALRGTATARLVRDTGGRLLGAYAFHSTPRRIAEVLAVVAVRATDRGRVFDHMLWEAAQGGAVAARGRVEPDLFSVLVERCVVIRPSHLMFVESRRQDLLAALGCGRTLLTRLDGEWWTSEDRAWPAPAESRSANGLAVAS